MAKLISKTYGDALFETALEQDTADALYEQILQLRSLLAENPKLMQLLQHPDISKEEKEQVLERIFADWLLPELYGFLRLILMKERIGALDSILTYVIGRYKAYRGIGVVYVASPMELTDAQKKQVEARVLSTTDFVSLEMHYSIEPALLGGLVIRIGDRVVDGSVRTELEKLTRQLRQIQIR